MYIPIHTSSASPSPPPPLTDGNRFLHIKVPSDLARFSSQGHRDRITEYLEHTAHTACKFCKGLPSSARTYSKSMSSPPVALFCHRPSQLPDQPLLEPSVLHQRRHQIVVKAAVCTQGRQGHHGIHTEASAAWRISQVSSDEGGISVPCSVKP